MPHITTDDNISIYYEDIGTGVPIIWVHEFAGDHRSWAPQVAAFSASYRNLTFAARGYPPSDVPHKLNAYSQARAAQDILALMDALKLERAHIVGLSMGGFATLHFGLKYPERALSLAIGGVGYGAEAEHAATFAQLSDRVAQQFETLGSARFAPIYAQGASRIQLQRKRPQDWQRFVDQLAEHDPMGAANTMRGVQARRPSLYTLETELQALRVPTLILCGDEDDHCLQPSLYLKRQLPCSGLAIFPQTGHTLNIEEPERFNQTLKDFLASAEAGHWATREHGAGLEIMRVDA